MKIRLHLAALAALGLFAFAPAARADMFNFSYTLPDGITPSGVVFAAGVLTTDPFDPVTGSYLVRDITGTRSSLGITNNITGLLPVNTLGGNDNLLYPSAPFLDVGGITYAIDGNNSGSGTNQVNIYFSNSRQLYTENGATDYGPTFTLTPVPSAVPEPGSIALLIGMATVGAGVLRRRRK